MAFIHEKSQIKGVEPFTEAEARREIKRAHDGAYSDCSHAVKRILRTLETALATLDDERRKAKRDHADSQRF